MKLTKLLCLSVLGLCIFGGAYAGSVGTTLDVSANVVPTCTVSTSPVAFPDFNNFVPVTATGNIDVTCSVGVDYAIAFDAGANYDGVIDRRMSDGGANYLAYRLWEDVTLTVMWGDNGYAATFPHDPVFDTGNGAVQPHTVYGEIPSVQEAPVGPYSDVVNVTIHY